MKLGSIKQVFRLLKKTQAKKLLKIGVISGKIAVRNRTGRKLFSDPERSLPPAPRKGKLSD